MNVLLAVFFFSIAIAWFIMKTYHKVVRPIKNTTLKLLADRSNSSETLRTAYTVDDRGSESSGVTVANVLLVVNISLVVHIYSVRITKSTCLTSNWSPTATTAEIVLTLYIIHTK